MTKSSGIKTVVRSASSRPDAAAVQVVKKSETTFDRVRDSAIERVVRSTAQGLSRAVLDLRVEGGGE